MSQPAAANDLNEGLHDHAMNRGAPPSMHDPASGPANLMGSLLSTFGPNFLLQGMAFMSSAQNAAATSTNEARKQNLETPGNSRLNIHDRRDSDEFVEEKSEAELQGYQVDSPPSGTGRFEEVDSPATPRAMMDRDIAALPSEGVAAGLAGVRVMQGTNESKAIDRRSTSGGNLTNYLFVHTESPRCVMNVLDVVVADHRQIDAGKRTVCMRES
jgi:hypothetical protein